MIEKEIYFFTYAVQSPKGLNQSIEPNTLSVCITALKKSNLRSSQLAVMFIRCPRVSRFVFHELKIKRVAYKVKSKIREINHDVTSNGKRQK